MIQKDFVRLEIYRRFKGLVFYYLLMQKYIRFVSALALIANFVLLPSGGVVAATKVMKKKAPAKVVRPVPKKLKAPAKKPVVKTAKSKKKPAPKKIEVKKQSKPAAVKAVPKKEEVMTPPPAVQPPPLPEEFPPAGY